MRSAFWLPVGIAIAVTAAANEVTIQNDSLANGSSGTIQAGFVAGEKAASWLTTPCDGNIVAAQVFWRSLLGNAPMTIEDSIDIYRSGTFPDPGALAQEIGGPVLTDGVINEYRYLDENDTIPLIVPVVQNETFIVALTFAEAPDPSQGPSVVERRRRHRAEPQRDLRFARRRQFRAGSRTRRSASRRLGHSRRRRLPERHRPMPMSASQCPPIRRNYTAGDALTYTITVSNAGPAAANSTTVVDAFPSAYTGVTWTCVASGGASCTSSGSGTIAATVTLPAGSQVVYSVDGIVAAGTTGTLTNSATAVVAPPASDPDTTNNTATLDLDPALPNDVIFADGFDGG